MTMQPVTASAMRAPIQYGGDALVWATWLYYAESRTQHEIAKALGVSRASVANYLAEARRRGLVKISLDPGILQKVSDSGALAQRFGLEGAMIAPSVDDPAMLRPRVGAAAALALTPHLGPEVRLGVAWGRTVIEVARALPEHDLPTLRVMQLSGSFLSDSEHSPETCAARVAGRLGARCLNFHAPAVLSSRAVRDALLAEPSLRRHAERTKRCDLVVFGVGQLSESEAWADTEFLPESVVRAYMERGGVGEVIGRFIDASGREVDGPLSGRQVGMELDDLKAVPMRLLATGGAAKLAAIRAALVGGYATHFVTDADTARLLMEDPAP